MISLDPESALRKTEFFGQQDESENGQYSLRGRWGTIPLMIDLLHISSQSGPIPG
jgi:hypothetical protein